MSTETEQATEEATDRADEAATELGRAIADLPIYERFEEAKAAVEADEAAQERIQEFERIRQEFVAARQTGEADQQALHELQQAQNELHELDVMDEFLEIQSQLEVRLQALNDRVSEEIVVDFGEKAGGCCADE